MDQGTRQLHYIYTPFGLIGVMIKHGTTENFYYAETDHLGSIISLLNSNGTYAEKYPYDACFANRSNAKVWGRMRDPATWVNYDPDSEPVYFDADRGFTGHELLS